MVGFRRRLGGAVLAVLLLTSAVAATGMATGDPSAASGPHDASSASADAVERQFASDATAAEELAPVREDASMTVTDDGGRARAVGTDVRPRTPRTLTMTQRIALTPDRPGEVRVTHVFDAPDGVASIETGTPEGATDVETHGLSPTDSDERRYHWDESTARPTLRYTYDVNETVDLAGPEGFGGDYLFVDAGDWALVRRPQVPVSWSWSGEEPVGFQQSATTDGAGYVGEYLAYLGAHETHTRSAHGQWFHLVVPDRASLAESPDAVLDAMADGSDRLRVGDRDEVVHAVAAPTDDISWGVRGLQFGDAAMWVRDRERLTAADNTWFHEYVHTRQGYDTEPSARWLEEATATYYAALLALETDRVGFEPFRAFLDRGAQPPRAAAVLADPADWSNAANYWKGALVLGDLDRRIRLATDGTYSFGTVFSELNARSEPVDGQALLDATGGVAGRETAATTSTFVTTSAVPEPWSASGHAAAFGETPARFTYRFGSTGGVAEGGPSLRVSGPYRNGSLAGPPVALYLGETLSVAVSVTNAGGAAAPYEQVFTDGGATRATVSGRLAPGETASHTVDHTFTSTGERQVAFGSDALDVHVYEPASANVTDVRVDPQSLDAPGTVTVAVTVTNEYDVPARRNVTVTSDGDPVETRQVSLGAGDSRTVSVPVELSNPGEHSLGVEGAGSTTISVGEEGNGNGALGPGFGPMVALLAVLVVALWGRTRRSA